MRHYELKLASAPERCGHPNRRFVPTPGLKHHGKELCEDCGSFLRWVPKPETLDRNAQNGKRIATLAGCPRLSEWERGFIDSISKQAKLSPRQQDCLQKLWDKHG